METIVSVTRWLFSGSIYGIAIIAAAVYFVAAGLKKITPKFPNPYAMAAIAFLAALFTVPSNPRYEFERKALSQIEGKDWIRIINKTTWRSITEPLTWFDPPIDSISIAMPISFTEGGYREILMRHEEKPRIRMSNPDCIDRTILYSEPDSKGMYRYTTPEAQSMNEQEASIYCEYDWTKEKEALREEMLK